MDDHVVCLHPCLTNERHKDKMLMLSAPQIHWRRSKGITAAFSSTQEAGVPNRCSAMNDHRVRDVEDRRWVASLPMNPFVQLTSETPSHQSQCKYKKISISSGAINHNHICSATLETPLHRYQRDSAKISIDRQLIRSLLSWDMHARYNHPVNQGV